MANLNNSAPNFYLLKVGRDCDGGYANNSIIETFYSFPIAEKLAVNFNNSSDGIGYIVVNKADYLKLYKENFHHFNYSPFL